MLFINLDLITELMGYNIHKCSKENKLLYYNDITNTSLEEDILFSNREQKVINSFCELEIYRKSLIGNNIAENIRSNFNLSFEREKELFTKLFVRDYLVQKENKKDLLLSSYLANKELFSSVALEERKEELTAIKLFEDFASPELKNDKEFARVILELDGSYIISMESNVRNSAKIMEIAMNNDDTRDVESFINSNSKLLKNSDFAIQYFKKVKANQKEKFSADQVYEEVFKQEDGKYVTTIFENNEQSSWMEDSNFLPRLAKIDSKFVEMISEGKIAPLSRDFKNRQIVKK